jgi:hypothetical protein
VAIVSETVRSYWLLGYVTREARECAADPAELDETFRWRVSVAVAREGYAPIEPPVVTWREVTEEGHYPGLRVGDWEVSTVARVIRSERS